MHWYKLILLSPLSIVKNTFLAATFLPTIYSPSFPLPFCFCNAKRKKRKKRAGKKRKGRTERKIGNMFFQAESLCWGLQGNLLWNKVGYERTEGEFYSEMSCCCSSLSVPNKLKHTTLPSKLKKSSTLINVIFN